MKAGNVKGAGVATHKPTKSPSAGIHKPTWKPSEAPVESK
jgi:hypothetical protein